MAMRGEVGVAALRLPKGQWSSLPGCSLDLGPSGCRVQLRGHLAGECLHLARPGEVASCRPPQHRCNKDPDGTIMCSLFVLQVGRDEGLGPLDWTEAAEGVVLLSTGAASVSVRSGCWIWRDWTYPCCF